MSIALRQGKLEIMKVARTVKGKSIEAAATAPKKAICPHCGGDLMLRSRRTMNNGGVTYYWRHRSNKNRSCSARTRPIG